MRAVVALSGDFNLQAIRVAEKYLCYAEPGRNCDTPVLVSSFWGGAGVGKSLKAVTAAYSEFGRDNVFLKKDGTKWWDGYDGQKCVVLDDFRPSWWSLTYMLALLDRYEFRVEFKGGYRQMRAVRFYITSITPPSMWYDHASGEPVEQITRRVQTVCEIKESELVFIKAAFQVYLDSLE